MDIAIERTAAVEKLKQMRIAHGQALLDGAPFNDTGIAHLEQKVAAFTTAQGIQARQARAAEAERRADLKANLAAELIDHEQTRLEAIASAEKACRQLVGALSAVICQTTQLWPITRLPTGRGKKHVRLRSEPSEIRYIRPPPPDSAFFVERGSNLGSEKKPTKPAPKKTKASQRATATVLGGRAPRTTARAPPQARVLKPC